MLYYNFFLDRHCAYWFIQALYIIIIITIIIITYIIIISDWLMTILEQLEE